MYTVRAKQSVAKEMVRYSGQEILSQYNPQNDPALPDMEEYRTFEFVISGSPNVSRWKSFGIDLSMYPHYN